MVSSPRLRTLGEAILVNMSHFGTVTAPLVCCLCLVLPGALFASDQDAVKRARTHGEAFLAAGRFQDALQSFARMEDACGQDPVCKAAARFFSGKTYLEMGQFEEAARVLNLAEKAFSSAHRNGELGTVLYTEGRVRAAEGDYLQALGFYSRSEEAFSAMERTPAREVGFLHANRATALMKLCRFDEAKQELGKARKLLEAFAPQGIVDLDWCEAEILSLTQDYPAATKIYEKLVEQFKKSGNQRGLARVTNDLGHVFEAQSKYVQAESLLPQCHGHGSGFGRHGYLGSHGEQPGICSVETRRLRDRTR